MLGILFHVAAVAPFICLFLLGKLAMEACREFPAACRRMLLPIRMCVITSPEPESLSGYRFGPQSGGSNVFAHSDYLCAPPEPGWHH